MTLIRYLAASLLKSRGTDGMLLTTVTRRYTGLKELYQHDEEKCLNRATVFFFSKSFYNCCICIQASDSLLCEIIDKLVASDIPHNTGLFHVLLSLTTRGTIH
jgi:hypothetical protein